MHLVLANQWYPPESGWGGVAMWNHALAHALRDLGHRVTVLAARSSEKIPAEQNADGIRIHRLLVRDAYRLRRLPILGRYVRPVLQLAYSARVDHALRDLLAHDPFDAVEFAEVNAEGFFYARHPLTPFVVRCHTPTFILKNYYASREIPYDMTLISRAERYLIRRAPALTAPSQDMARVISETTGVPLDRVAVVPNALTLADFQLPHVSTFQRSNLLTSKPSNHPTIVPSKVEGTQLPNDSTFQRSNVLTILFVGRLERVKGVEILAQAIPSVLKRVPSAHFVFIGDDLLSERGNSQRAELEKFLKQANALAQVEFLGGVTQEILLDGYRRADICVVPSLLYESFSYTAAQAMAFGKPIVASRIGGIPETVDDGVSGILCEPGNVAEFADALVRLASNRDLRTAFGRAGREKVEREFDARVIAQKYLKVVALAQASFSAFNRPA